MKMNGGVDGGLHGQVHVTKAGLSFLTQRSRLIRLYADMADMASWADAQDRANASLWSLVENDEDQSARLELLAKSTRHTDKIRANSTAILETLATRSVDQFLSYVGLILREIFLSNPHALRSGQTVRVDEVLQFDDLTDLIGWLAEERVSALAYKGFRELQGDLQKAIGFTLVPEENDLDDMVSYIEVRNLLVHNMGIVNRRFLQRTGLELPLDEPLSLASGMAHKTVKHVAELFLDIDQRAATKYGLATVQTDIENWSTGLVLSPAPGTDRSSAPLE